MPAAAFTVAMLMSFSLLGASSPSVEAQSPTGRLLVRDPYGAVVRGDVSKKQLSLVFTGDMLGESTAPILDALKERRIRAGLFVTGNFVRAPSLRPFVKRAIAEKHYVGPHSDAHLLYAPWDDRDTSLVSEKQFKADLRANLAALQKLGHAPGADSSALFIPPYEWYNADHVRWSRDLGMTLINFTPGSGSNRDYAPEGNPRFVPARTIYDDILAYEAKDPHGLNGFILLLHLGSGRQDPFHPLLGPLCDELSLRGYRFLRIDELIGRPAP